MVNTSAWAGATYAELNAAGTHISRANFYIQLGNQTPAGWRRSTACRELGHALGLAHRAPSDSCMRADGIYPNLPDGHDFDQLWLTYNHSH